jgi:hypothetical protein
MLKKITTIKTPNMKNIILLVSVLFVITLTSCKEEHKHSGETHEHNKESLEHKSHDTNEHNEIAMVDKYQCPMDCKKGKTLDEEGQCSVCKMTLKKVHDESVEGHDNDADHEEDHDSEH